MGDKDTTWHWVLEKGRERERGRKKTTKKDIEEKDWHIIRKAVRNSQFVKSATFKPFIVVACKREKKKEFNCGLKKKTGWCRRFASKAFPGFDIENLRHCVNFFVSERSAARDLVAFLTIPSQQSKTKQTIFVKEKSLASGAATIAPLWLLSAGLMFSGPRWHFLNSDIPTEKIYLSYFRVNVQQKAV